MLAHFSNFIKQQKWTVLLYINRLLFFRKPWQTNVVQVAEISLKRDLTIKYRFTLRTLTKCRASLFTKPRPTRVALSE